MTTKNAKIIILEGDILSLSNSFKLRHIYLHDEILRAKHRLNLIGRKLVVSLISGVNYRDFQKLANGLGAPESQYQNLLIDLNQLGALSIKRRPAGYPNLLKLVIISYLAGYIPEFINRRYRSTAYGVAQATGRALGLLGLAWLGVLPLVYGSNLFEFTDFLYYSAITGLLIGMSLFTHEYSHSLIARRKTPSVMLQAGWSIGLVHGQLSVTDEVISSIIGPLVGCLTALCLGVIVPNGWTVGLFVVGLHLLSWLPGFGDSWSVFKNLKSKPVTA